MEMHTRDGARARIAPSHFAIGATHQAQFTASKPPGRFEAHKEVMRDGETLIVGSIADNAMRLAPPANGDPEHAHAAGFDRMAAAMVRGSPRNIDSIPSSPACTKHHKTATTTMK